MNKYEKITAATKSPGVAQIVSYLVLTLECILFYTIICTNFSSKDVSVPLIVLYSCSLLALIFAAVICSCTDPSDRVMIIYRNEGTEK